MTHSHRPRLAQDLRALASSLSRRQILGFFGGAGVLALAGCVDGGDDGTGDGGGGSCAKIPEETAGPYPGDGTNGKDALALAGIVRSDIRSSIGGATGVAAGVPLTVTLTLLDASGCAPLAGRAVYLWHCDREGNYSMYSAAVAGENYLRGVQVTDDRGQVRFTTVFPGCYAGRWPHIHFEVYAGIASATNGRNAIATSQLALPQAACDDVYGADAGYAASVANLRQISLPSDNVFRDGADQQLAAITGDPDAGYAAALTMGISG
jgi:protocatechuate 3,4-dioxygenase beta subunit